MQQPTLQNVRVRTTRDALMIFYAVARRILPMITRRLDAEERRAIAPGNVYIWEERCANSEITGLGMERWTDGISWSASRIAQEFLFYRQRDSDAEPIHTSAQWAKAMKRDPRLGAPSCPRSEADRLIKQTYSVHVSLPEDRPRGITRKWHLTAYFSQATLDTLNTVDMIPGVGDVAVPQGWFRNARASKAKQGDMLHEDGGSSPPRDTWTGSYSPSATYRSEFVIDTPISEDGSSRLPASSVISPPRGSPRAHYQNTGNGSQGLQQVSPSYPPRLPTLSDSGLDFFRDPSPFTQSSTSSSELGSSPRPFSTPLTPPAAHAQPGAHARQPEGAPERALVPLAFLKTLQPPVRDATAEDCLRRLSGATLAGTRSPPPQRWQEPVSAQSSR